MSSNTTALTRAPRGGQEEGNRVNMLQFVLNHTEVSLNT